MDRRSFMKHSGAVIILSQLFGCNDLSYFIRKMKSRLIKKDNRKPQKSEASLSQGWEEILVNTALNSRCMSDYDDNPTLNHWGMADGSARLSEKQLQLFDATFQFYSLFKGKTGMERSGNMLLFYIDSKSTGTQRDSLIIELGSMIQNASLIAAAMGIGIVCNNRGENGAIASNGKWGMLSFCLEPMKPSYMGDFWSNAAPSGERPWLSGNLPDPERVGNLPLTKAIANVAQRKKGNKAVVKRLLGQMLWAARGRTPHFYLSKTWGMTIPVAHGVQSRSDVLLATESGELKRYVNWSEGRPTHALAPMQNPGGNSIERLKLQFPSRNAFLLLRSMESTGYALLEIGFMLQNILLEATELDVSIDYVIDIQEIPASLENGNLRAAVALTMQ
jgi:hypothetical protein